MYLQETYISDEEALDIVLEYLWNEYDYETEEELYEAYDFLTDEEFEDILNENIFRDAGGAVIDAVKGAIKTGAKSFRERRAISNFNNAVKKKKNRKPDNVGQHSVQQTPNIADRVAPKASKQKATSSVVPVKFGNKVGTKPGVRTMDTSTVVPVNRYAAERRGPAADAFNKRQLRKNRQEQPGPNITAAGENKRKRREKTAELKQRRDTGEGRTVRPIPAGQTRKGRPNTEPVAKHKTYVNPKTGRKSRRRATYVEPKPPKQNPVPEFKSGKKRSGGKGFDVKKPPTKEEKRAKREARKVKELRNNYKKPKAYTNQTPSYMSNDGKKVLNPGARKFKSNARSNRLKQAVKDGTPVFYGFNRSY